MNDFKVGDIVRARKLDGGEKYIRIQILRLNALCVTCVEQTVFVLKY